MAERQGFEPWVPFGTTVFKTVAIDRSAISPCGRRMICKALRASTAHELVFSRILENLYIIRPMKKVVAILLPLVLTSCSLPGLFGAGTKNEPESSSGASDQADNGSGASSGSGFIERQSKEEKVSEAKRRLNLRSIIRKGDYYSAKNDKEAALRYYENALARLGGKDRVVEQKMADVLFELKRFPEAYSHYKNLPLREIDSGARERLLLAFMFDETVTDRQSQLDSMPFDQTEKEYYSHIGTCYTGVHNCVVRIQEYRGTEPRLGELFNTIKDYESLSNDYQYRNALLAGTLYKQKQYLAAAKIAEEIVEKRPNYRSAVKIAGFSRFELGEYEKANAMLKRYFDVEPKDIQVAYALGIINYYLEDYSMSNLYFNNAVINGYRPKTELERRLVYNYYLLGDKRGTFKIFRYLLDEADATKEDFEIAVFTAIEEREYGKAFLWAEKGMEKFPDDDRLVAMRGWVSQIRDEDEKAVKDFTKALEMNRRNPIALLRFGILYKEKGDFQTAKGYFEAAKEADTSGTFGEDAQKEIEEL